MQLEVGKIYEGKVNGITKFGAFVDLDTEPKTKGMVHISEVANTYVEDIKEHLKEGQIVKVKVLSLGENGKVALSIKKTAPPPANRQPQANRGGGRNSHRDRDSAPASPEAAFEDMMSKFKQSSDERMSDLKKVIDNKRRSSSRRK
ncbi:MAG: S1 RNA-binding domain-containing protein [Oscillospiraceae bacterium]|nr:S1 RNA-binding domain-containing protein [Oscillospiraceae bacterium]